MELPFPTSSPPRTSSQRGLQKTLPPKRLQVPLNETEEGEEREAARDRAAVRQPNLIINGHGASLEVQWLRIRLPMQRTWVRSLVREDPTCHGATKPVRHNY